MNDRSDVNRNDTDSTDMNSDSDYSGLIFPDVYCAQLNYTVSNDYITIVSTIASDCVTDPTSIPVGLSFELRYNPSNPRDFIKQKEYYDDVTNLCIRIVLAVIMSMSLISFMIKFRNLPDDVDGFVGDTRFGRDLETGESSQESPEARKERILSKMIFQLVKEDLSNTTADVVRSYQKETNGDAGPRQQESESDPASVDDDRNDTESGDDRVPTENGGSKNTRNITIETVDGTHSSPECATEEDLEREVGAKKAQTASRTRDQIDARIDQAHDPEAQNHKVHEELTPNQENDREDAARVFDPVCPETCTEEREGAAGSKLQSMLSSFMRSEESEESEAECCICLDRYDPGDTICASKVDECNHVFHKDCIINWMMKNHNQCPLCRVDLLK